MNKQTLVNVPIRGDRPKQMIKATLKPKNKSVDKPEDKENRSAENKQGEDLTVIPGVGPATVRLLSANGVYTFDDLKKSSLHFLSDGIKKIILDYLDG